MGKEQRVIYADNAATTSLDKEAFEAMKPFLTQQYGNASQPYSLGMIARKAIKESRLTIAECIGSSPEEIYFTSCGTESDNWVLKQSVEKDKQIAVSQIEHHAILNSCSSLEKQGIQVTYIPVNCDGIVLSSSLENALINYTSLVSIMMANNEIGTIQNIGELAATAHQHNSLFHTDAVQALGHINVDVRKLNVDYLSASAHKFNGPKGIGFLYAKKGVPLFPMIDGGSQEFGMRAGTENVASIVGMAIALKNNISQLNSNAKYILELENRLISRLKESRLDFIRNGSNNHIPGNISLSFRESDGEMLLHRLDIKGICISTGSACDSVNTQISHVIQAIGVDEKYAKGTIRISLGKNNTIEDVDRISSEIAKILC